MKCVINTSVDYIMEAIVLMYNYVNEEDYPSLKKKLVNKYSLNAAIQSKFDIIIKTSNYVYENLTVDKERLDYYFKKINDESLCIARMIMLIHSRGGTDTISSVINRIVELEPRIMYSRMIDYLAEFSVADSSLTDARVADISLTEVSLMSGEDLDSSNYNQQYYLNLIDKLNVESENKWNIAKAFINYRDYVHELGVILEEVIKLIKDCIEDIQYLTKDCVDYWTKFLKENDLSEYLQKYFNLNLELRDVTDNIRMIPLIFGCNSMAWTIEYRENSIRKDQSYLLMYTGILFSEHFNMNLKWFDKTEVNAYLKLLSDKSKMDILLYIKDKKAYGQELATQFNLTTATISHHMSALHASGFINLERDNNRVYYSMDKENIIVFLDNVKRMLTD